MRGSVNNIWTAIWAGTVLAVLDGMFQHANSAATWTIEWTTSTNRVTGLMITPGNPGDYSSFQSKATSIYSLLLTLWYILEQEMTTCGSIKVACNGHSVLDHLQTKKDIDPFAVHADLLQASRNLQAQLPCRVVFSHIKGHQNTMHLIVLSWAAWLNIKANLLAKAKVDPACPKKAQYKQAYKSWHVAICGQCIAKQHK